MRINAENSTVINSKDISVHDWIFENMVFNYLKKEMSIYLIEDSGQNRKHILKLYNVLGFKMTTGDFWGKSLHILDWELVEDNYILLDELFEEKEKYEYSSIRLDEKKLYIESIITLISGDKLIIVCEYIDFL